MAATSSPITAAATALTAACWSTERSRPNAASSFTPTATRASHAAGSRLRIRTGDTVVSLLGMDGDGSDVGDAELVPAGLAGYAVGVVARVAELLLPGAVGLAVGVRPVRSRAGVVAAASLGDEAAAHRGDDRAVAAAVEELGARERLVLSRGLHRRQLQLLPDAQVVGILQTVQGDQLGGGGAVGLGDGRQGVALPHRVRAGAARGAAAVAAGVQIGRASCRERVEAA